MKNNDKIVAQFGSELTNIIAEQALTISKLKVLFEQEQSKNAELNIQIKALRKEDKHGRSDTKHK
ncbi:hypothetical protein HCN73_04595 [Lactobacillus crispatus]|uniref:hypothetical protein n=1 Tax=Lactobacillus crispatus TaxID=47770 RepID=UPI0015EBB855|nr:hypothetical protein [Lactobacillus crispatus]MBA2915626.1 hypothetical protein [Lactobacillus crispatus]